MNGLLIAIQFFTVIPIKKELPLGRKEVTAMFIALPFVGGVIGAIMYAVSILMLEVLGTGTLITAVFIVLTSIIMTGGLHLDGWADTGDAFFSYQDREKRLEILEDPRLGAFGTIGLVLLIIVKIALFHEVLEQDLGHMALFIALPLLARVGLNSYFATIQSAKNKGLAYFFKENIEIKWVILLSIISGVAVLIGLGYVVASVMLPLILFAVIAVGILLYRNWSLKHFGGVTGDLLGSFIEGMEAVLWIFVLLSL